MHGSIDSDEPCVIWTIINEMEITVFYKHQGSRIIILAVYVDDIVITGYDVKENKELKEKLSRAFEIG